MHHLSCLSCCPHPLDVYFYPIESCYNFHHEHAELIHRAYQRELYQRELIDRGYQGYHEYYGYPGYPGYYEYHRYQKYLDYHRMYPQLPTYERPPIYNGPEHGKG